MMLKTVTDLRHYYDQQMRAWFGEVRPLRLEGAGRFFTPAPTLPLRAVFVPPALSRSYVQASPEEPDLANCADILGWLDTTKRVVVLGDPGSGKSTLVSWVTWRLCAGLTEPLPTWCDGVIPVPMVLRDMALGEVRSLDDLIESHVKTDLIAGHKSLGSAWAEALRQRIQEAPETLLFLVDGLDELPAGLHEPVRDALRTAMQELPHSRFVVTSRIVGYEQNALDAPDAQAGLETEGSGVRGLNVSRDVQRLYVTPFDNSRIRQFAKNWFLHGESEHRRNDAYAQKFIDGLFADPVALQLGRIPNLLVMAAQVFGITNTLPDGRAKLYEAITKAYLESIDQLYGLGDSRFSFEQKSTWLAAVGYWMQLRRGKLAAGENARELLATEAEVAGWLIDAMKESGLAADETYVHSFVDAIARRSGLFIPRGEGLYAFAHLSIQEYFAALHLHRRVRELALTDSRGLAKQKRELARLAELNTWRETLITFYELPGWLPRELPTLFDAVFGKNFEKVPAVAVVDAVGRRAKNAAVVELLARLVVNPSIPLSEELRHLGFESAMRYVSDERKNVAFWKYSGVLSSLTANDVGEAWFWRWFSENPKGLLNKQGMMLSGLRVRDYSRLTALREVTWLELSGSAITDLAPLSGLDQLKRLGLSLTAVHSLAPISGFRRLEDLDLIGSEIVDLAPLATVTSLESLWLSGSLVTDLSPLRRLTRLETLFLGCFQLRDIGPLAGLTNLKELWLEHTAVEDVSALAQLKRLEHLDVNGSPVKNLDVLSHLTNLQIKNANKSVQYS